MLPCVVPWLLLLAVTVASVLADSAVVTLALPDILQHLDASVGQVAWVLISFNLVLGIVAVPAAVASTGPSRGSSAPSASRCSPAPRPGVRWPARSTC